MISTGRNKVLVFLTVTPGTINVSLEKVLTVSVALLRIIQLQFFD